MKKESIKPFVWGFVAGAVVLFFLVIVTGWMVTGSSAQTKAERMAEEAVFKRLAPICVAQFMQDPNKEMRLKELKKTDSWKRDEYVKDQGWATMPGEKEPDSKVAYRCIDLIMELEK